jgi:hypothetical protein
MMVEHLSGIYRIGGAIAAGVKSLSVQIVIEHFFRVARTTKQEKLLLSLKIITWLRR